MGRLLIGNAYNEHLVADLDAFDPVDRRAAGNIAVRLAWLLEPGDALVVPQTPDPTFLRYVLGLKGISTDSVSVLKPPPGRYGDDVLSGERLLDPAFLEELRAVSRARGIDQILPYSFDGTVAQVARELGLAEGTPGFAFLDAGGSDLLNSKSVFRTIAAGVGVPVAEGTTASSRRAAESFINRLLDRGEPVIVKQDFHSGGFGNDILSPHPGVEPVGAPRSVVLSDTAAVARHLDRHWGDYSNGGRNPVVIERYIVGSVALGAEVRITHDSVLIHHIGEMRMTPIFDGIVIPGHVADEAQQAAYLEAMHRLSEPLQAMGYRGFINIDGLLTPTGDVLLSEFNGRLGGTTHLHWIGEHFLGKDYADRRLLVTRNHWKVPSTAEALSRLEAAGLAFDAARGTGVIVTCDHVRQCGAVEYCAIAEDAETALGIEATLATLFA